MKRTIAVLVVSLGLGLAGLAIVGGAAVFDLATYRVERPDRALLALAVTAAVAQWVLPALRLMLLARPQGIRVHLGTALGLHLAYTLGCALTPGGSGGGPALAAGWRALGVAWGRGIAMAVQLFVLDLAFLASTAAAGALVLVVSGRWVPPVAVLVLTLSAVSAATALAAVLATSPRTVTRWLLWIARLRWPRPMRPLTRPRPSARTPGAPHLAREYLRAARALRSAPPVDRATLHVVNVAGWLAQYVALWALVNLYQAAEFVPLVASLAVASFAAVAVPTPGASGVMEVLVGLGALANLDRSVVAAPILLWRISTFYVVFVAGPMAGWRLLDRARGGSTARTA